MMTILSGPRAGRRRGDPPNLDISPAALDEAHEKLIADSHLRCMSAGLSRIGLPEQSRPRVAAGATPAKNQQLLDVATPMMEMLHSEVAHSHCLVALTDACATVLHTVGDPSFLAEAAKIALTPGVDWSESTRGTNGIGTTLMSEVPTVVHGDEHFLYAHHFLTSSATPIFDPRGSILGILQVTGDRRGYHRHTMGLVRIAATMVENQYLNHTRPCALVIHLHERAEFLGTLMDGRLAVRRNGQIIGGNRNALDRLGLSHAAARFSTITSLFGWTVEDLASHFAGVDAGAIEVVLGNGASCFLRVHFDWSSWYGLDRSLQDAIAIDDRPELRAPASAAGEAVAPALAQQKIIWPAACTGASGLAFLETGDPKIHAVIQKVRKVLDRDIAVLILGETGTGKELLARGIHQESSRAERPFVAVNCASIPEALIEAELFGHERGAFTGARSQGAPGKFMQAHGGTLFLDEIGDMPLALQARLLRVLQDRTVTPLGGQTALPIEVNLICATHRDLLEMVETGSFREDLYYRVNGLCVKLPALRDRVDLAALVKRFCTPPGAIRTVRLAPDVEELFTRSRWPGNVRQLSNILHTAVAMANGAAVIQREHLADDFLDGVGSQQRVHELPTAVDPASLTRLKTMEEMTLDTIRQAVVAAEGNISQASKALHISRNTIYRKLHWAKCA